jgi:ribosome assembly protein RRB1
MDLARSPSPVPYLPRLGQGSSQLEDGEQLVPDLSSYILLHHARLTWPALSFDVLRDVSLSLR